MAKTRLAVAAMVLAIGAGSPALAALQGYTFNQITTNGAPVSAHQYLVEVFDGGETFLGVTPTVTQVGFRFTNTGPIASSITDVYFDDGALLGIASVTESAGVSFTILAKPAELPSANNVGPKFETSAGFSADSDPPVQPNGVNEDDESLVVLFNLLAGQDYGDVISSLNAGLVLNPNVDADLQGVNLRIGIKVQGFANNASESFVNGPPPPGEIPPPPVPEPASLAIWGLGLGLAGFFARRMRKAA